MKLAKCSEDRFWATFELWRVPDELAEPIFNYLVHGWNPGSFYSAVLANDFGRAVQSSHPSNSIPALKTLVGWLRDHAPQASWGSWGNLQAWEQLSDAERRAQLEVKRLIYTEKEETWQTLKAHA